MKVDRIFCNGEALSSYTRVTPFVSERDVTLTFVSVISLFHHDLQKRTVTVFLWYRENVEFGWSFLQTRKTQRPGIEQTAINVWGIYLQHREYFVNVKFEGSTVGYSTITIGGSKGASGTRSLSVHFFSFSCSFQ